MGKHTHRHKNVNQRFINFEDAITYDHLLKAYRHCRKGKKFRAATVKFHIDYVGNLLHLLELLKTGQYEIDDLYSFIIFEPKMREIIANRFLDKIVQRAICKYILEPKIKNRLIYDNYASQEGKGNHTALKRLEHNMRSYSANIANYGDSGYVAVCDIHHYFYTIDREICFNSIKDLAMDNRCKLLVRQQIYAIEEFNHSTVGLCIGFQASQWLAVYYLDPLDHFIKEQLHIKYYGRYMDDFYLIHEDREYLEYCMREITRFVETKLHLTMNPKSHIQPYSQGICFLGYHIYYNTKTHDTETYIRSASINKTKKRTKRQKALIDRGQMTTEQALLSLESWKSYAVHGESKKSLNAYNEARKILLGSTDDFTWYRESLPTDSFDREGFIVLKPTDQYLGSDGFIKLVPRTPRNVDKVKLGEVPCSKSNKAKYKIRGTMFQLNDAWKKYR